MTVGEWLDGRQPEPPPRLGARIASALGVRTAEPEDRAADTLVDACAALLEDVVSRRAAGRESALDLLAADALATYALEAACASPAAFPACARDAMRRFAALATA